MSNVSPGKAQNFLRHLEPLEGALEGFCRRMLRDQGELQDALQSAIASAFQDFHLYAEGTNFRAWIFKYVYLETCNRNRKHERNRHEALPAELPIEETWQIILDEPLFKTLLDDPDAVLEQCDARLSEAIRSLSPREQSVFLLRVIGEFKYREIAEILEIPIGSVMGHLAHARLKLRQELVEYAEEQGLLKRQAPE